jgi:hypothetical protein
MYTNTDFCVAQCRLLSRDKIRSNPICVSRDVARHKNHVSLSLRVNTTELEQVCTGPENIFGERTPCKKLADHHPRQGKLLQTNNFSAVYKTSLHFTK